MAVTKRKVEYFYVMVEDQPGAAFKLLSELTESGVNLLAFSATPMWPELTQVVLYPEDPIALA